MSLHSKSVSVLCGVLLLSGCGVAEAPVEAAPNVEDQLAERLQDRLGWSESLAGFETQLREHVEADDVAGLSVGVFADGEVAWGLTAGWKDRDADAYLGKEDLFRTGSISKAVTALLLLRLVDDGVVGLDERVLPYLPELADAAGAAGHASQVTFRHLASHTSGLESAYDEGLATPVEEWREGVVESLRRVSFEAMPGTEYEDSPIGYGALGLALERAAGLPFPELVRTEVFEPIGMANSSFDPWADDMVHRIAVGHPNRRDRSMETPAPRRFGGGGYTLPASGLYSTASDLALLLGVIAGHAAPDFLTAEGRRELASVQTPGGLEPPRAPGVPMNGIRVAVFRDLEGGRIRSPEVLDPPQSLGFAVHIDGEDRRVLHTGGIVDGYTTYMAVDLDTGVGVVLLRNYWRGATELRKAALGLTAQLGDLTGTAPRGIAAVPPRLWILLAVLAAALFAGPLRRISEVPPGRARGRP